VGGLLVLPDVTNLIHRDQIIALAARHRLPAVYPYRYYAASGGLLSYGSEQADVFRRAAYTDRFLHIGAISGEKSAYRTQTLNHRKSDSYAAPAAQRRSAGAGISDPEGSGSCRVGNVDGGPPAKRISDWCSSSIFSRAPLPAGRDQIPLRYPALNALGLLQFKLSFPSTVTDARLRSRIPPALSSELN
jgi:hypothetical protein